MRRGNGAVLRLRDQHAPAPLLVAAVQARPQLQLHRRPVLLVRHARGPLHVRHRHRVVEHVREAAVVPHVAQLRHQRLHHGALHVGALAAGQEVKHSGEAGRHVFEGEADDEECKQHEEQQEEQGEDVLAHDFCGDPQLVPGAFLLKSPRVVADHHATHQQAHNHTVVRANTSQLHER